MTWDRAIRWAVFLLLGWGSLHAQTAPPAATNAPSDGLAIIKANTRLVVVDVLAIGSDGKPVHGLKAQDLTVLEDGKPQPIRNFEEQRSDAKPAPPLNLNLPKDVYTNFVSRTEHGALTVLLFDSLNTDRQSLPRAKREMLDFLKTLPPDKRVAIFTLSSQLRMVQSFTEDSQTLLAAAQRVGTNPHSTYTNARQFSEAIAELKETALAGNPKAFRAMAGFLGEDYEGHVESRVESTLDGLNQLARALAVVPGRKNLLWICGSVPFDMVSDSPQVHKTAALLAATQIAVYPIDVRGVISMTADGATRSSEVFGQIEPYETTSGQGDENTGILASMTDMAKLTGGRAYYNRNDLRSAISDSMESGSNYYTVSYRPQNANWNGKFRKIAVKSGQPNVHLVYRNGYYAVPDPVNSKDDANRTFAVAMQPDAPASTLLIMKARVVPPGEPDKPTAIDFLIDAHALSFVDGPEKQKTPEVQFVAVAWNDKGEKSGSFSLSFHQTLAPPQMESLLRTGLQLHQDLLLKPGSYQLRLGVMDRITGRIGTMDIPLTIESKVAEK